MTENDIPQQERDRLAALADVLRQRVGDLLDKENSIAAAEVLAIVAGLFIDDRAKAGSAAALPLYVEFFCQRLGFWIAYHQAVRQAATEERVLN